MRGLLVASGGIDSTTLMYELARQGDLAMVMLFDYGQASRQRQIECVTYHAKEVGAPLQVMQIPWPTQIRGSGHIFRVGAAPQGLDDAYDAVKMTHAEYQKYLYDRWNFLEGRNIVFHSYACAWAIATGLKVVYNAFQFDAPEWESVGHRTNARMGNDTSGAWVRAFNQLATNDGFSKPVKVVSPYLEQQAVKLDIVGRARRLDVNLEMTHSCEFFPACGVCHQCLIRKEVLDATTFF